MIASGKKREDVPYFEYDPFSYHENLKINHENISLD